MFHQQWFTGRVRTQQKHKHLMNYVVKVSSNILRFEQDDGRVTEDIRYYLLQT